ncbi:MAG: murein biosynthesis integral membrane protein MurJ [Acidobacteria bacterium]|nr:murein biosynthesis integral membrane protein MurJ [Acidobacteriota bacterium]
MSLGSGLYRSAGLVGLWTLVSRLSGMLQQRVLVHFLGQGLASDLFFVAYRLPNLLRRFAAEGTMTAAFLPTISEVEAAEGEDGARDMVARFLGTLGLLLLLLCILAMVGMGLIMGVQMLGRIAPGAPLGEQFGALGQVLAGTRPAPEGLARTVLLGRIMFPYLALVSLTAGLSAVLNLKGRFGLPASVSTFFNVTVMAVVLGGVLLGPPGWREPMQATVLCALAVLAGGLVQLGLLWPSFRSLGNRISWGFHFGNAGVKRILRRMVPGLLGTGIHPINVVVSTAIASQLPAGAQTVLYQSNLMGELVLGLFSASLATVSLPAMSRLADEGDLEGLRGSLASALRATALMAIPASVGLAVLARPILALIFQSGRYGEAAVAWTAATLPYQALGLLFVATSRISVQALYALKDYRGPALAALLGFGLNLPLSWILMHRLGTSGIALANSLASIAGLAFVAWRLHRRLGQLPLGSVGRGWGAFSLGAACMGALAWGLGLGVDVFTFHGPGGTALRLLPLIAVSGGFYFLLLRMVRVPEAGALWAALAGKLRAIFRRPSGGG